MLCFFECRVRCPSGACDRLLLLAEKKYHMFVTLGWSPSELDRDAVQDRLYFVQAKIAIDLRGHCMQWRPDNKATTQTRFFISWACRRGGSTW